LTVLLTRPNIPGVLIACETERLVLRNLTLDDLEPLAAIHADAEVMKFVGGARTLAQTRARLVELIDAYDRVGFSKWAVIHRASGEFIGRCGPILERVAGVDEIEVGYDLARRFWGQGLATEAARAAVEHCFVRLGRARVISIIHPQNVASQQVARRLGMAFERDVEWRGGTFGMYAKSATA
jgi:ribosomal-protein-alanine N-acetyltransferase